jgi:hypothetical protein
MPLAGHYQQVYKLKPIVADPRELFGVYLFFAFCLGLVAFLNLRAYLRDFLSVSQLLSWQRGEEKVLILHRFLLFGTYD